MQIIKSIADGIGTAAGVAWPTFGIIASTLALSTAGIPSLVLGSISSALFFLVGIPIAIWSYKKSMDDDNALDIALKTQQDHFRIYLTKYICCIVNEILYEYSHQQIVDTEVFMNIVKYKIACQLMNNLNRFSTDERYILEHLIKTTEGTNFILDIIMIMQSKLIMKNNSPAPVTVKNFDAIKNTLLFSTFFIGMEHRANNKEHYSISSYITTCITYFCAAFGSIAGCAAGTLGMLTSTGIILGLSCTPIIGWAVLAAAILFGILVAIVGSYHAHIKNKKNNLVNYFKLVNETFRNTMIINEIRLETKIEMAERNIYSSKLKYTSRPRRPISDSRIVNSNSKLWKLSVHISPETDSIVNFRHLSKL